MRVWCFLRCRFAKGEDKGSRGFEIPAALDVDAMPGNLAFSKKRVKVEDRETLRWLGMGEVEIYSLLRYSNNGTEDP